MMMKLENLKIENQQKTKKKKNKKKKKKKKRPRPEFRQTDQGSATTGGRAGSAHRSGLQQWVSKSQQVCRWTVRLDDKALAVAKDTSDDPVLGPHRLPEQPEEKLVQFTCGVLGRTRVILHGFPLGAAREAKLRHNEHRATRVEHRPRAARGARAVVGSAKLQLDERRDELFNARSVAALHETHIRREPVAHGEVRRVIVDKNFGRADALDNAPDGLGFHISRKIGQNKEEKKKKKKKKKS
jgi:hypothetical protein